MNRSREHKNEHNSLKMQSVTFLTHQMSHLKELAF